MRLLKCTQPSSATNAASFSLVNFLASEIPYTYAILSHRWSSDEVTFDCLRDGKAESREGYRKLEFCAKQAAADGIVYFWIDTCCIDKANYTELSEAINSMFKWYKNATKCYVYMPDVSVTDQHQVESTHDQWIAAFRASVWFTRGWTLQELVAPSIVEFFSKEGKRLGGKRSLEQEIGLVTGIPLGALQGAPLSRFGVQERLTWAARRVTTVEEDAAYCLMGLFDVYMPLIYGEGRQKATTRLQREIQVSIDTTSELSAGAPWIVPFERNMRFTGRHKELASLEQRLFTPGRTSKWAIIGLGGVGKSQLVIELLHRMRLKYRDCTMLWISAINNEVLYQGYVSIAQGLEIPGSNDEKVDAIELVRNHLSRPSSNRWLLVVDNVDDIEMWTHKRTSALDAPGQGQSQRLMDRLPRNERGCIIYTTRNRKAATILAGPNILQLSVMEEDIALSLLGQYLIDPVPPNQSELAAQLVAELAYLPLAIVQATAYINANGCTLRDYQQLLQQKEEEVVDLLSEDFEAEGRSENMVNPVATTWLISFESIRKHHPLAAEYLSIMACVHNKDIPQSLLPPGPTRLKEMEAIGTLTAYSFVERRARDPALDSVFDLHRLVHLATRNWLRKEGLLATSREKTLDHLGNVFPFNNPENRNIWRTLLPHAQYALQSDMEERLSRGEKAKSSRALLVCNCASCLQSDGRSREAETLLREYIKYNNNTIDLMTALSLPTIQYDLGRHGTAELLQTQVVAALETQLGADNILTLESKHNLAKMYRDQGRWDDAEKLALQTIRTSKSMVGADHRITLASMSSLATTYLDQGRWREAEQLQLKVFETRKSMFGMEHLETAGSAANLAMNYSQQGRWKEAEELHGRSIETKRRVLGSNHPHTLSGMNNLSSTYMYQQRWKEAEELLLQVTKTHKETLGSDDPRTLASLLNLALTYAHQDRLDEAEKLELHVLEVQRNRRGIAHPSTLSTMANLATTYMNQKRYTEAEELQRQVTEMQRDKFGPDHPETLLSLHNLAWLCAVTDRYPEAITLMMDCIERQARVWGTNHPQYLVSFELLRIWLVKEYRRLLTKSRPKK